MFREESERSMKKFLGFFIVMVFLSTALYAADELVVADFDKGEPPNNIGGSYGSWNHDPQDDTQGCYMFAEPDDYKNPDKGYCLRLDYDVQSKNPAFNGFWMKLKGLDVSSFNVLSFWIKGGSEGKFTTRLKLELKDGAGRRAIYPIEGVTDKWQEIKINFKNTKSDANWKNVSELVLVFDDILATYKEGTILVDQFSFKK